MNQLSRTSTRLMPLYFVIILLFSQINFLFAQSGLKQSANDQEKNIAGSNTVQRTKVSLKLPAPLTKSKATISQSTTTSQGGLVTIVSENFEGAFPSGLWSVSSGNYSWAKRNVLAHNGSNSAWAIGGGTVGSTLNYNASYPNSVTTTMVYGPFDLSDANWAAFSFYVWQNLQDNSDYLLFMASDDGSNFYGYALSGSTGGNWYPYSLPLHAVPTAGDSMKNFAGKPAVWIAFYFQSDASGNLTNGVFVDDVVLQKGLVNVPTILTSFPTPGTSSRGLAWDGTSLWCSDATNDRIYKLNNSGGVISSFVSPSTTPTGLTWDGTNLWNADATNDRIYKLSSTGSVLSSFATPGVGPAGIAWDGANFWNSDYNVETIWKLNASGAVLSTFSAPGTYHYGLTYDGQNLWLVDADVLLMYKIDPAGNVLDYSLTPATFPSGLAWDGNYFWMTDRSTNLIYKLQVQTQQITNDIGVVSMDLPARLSPGDSTAIKISIKNYGTTSQSNFPVSYNINGGAAVTENFLGTLAAGAASTMTFSKTWRPTLEGSYQFMAWTNLAGDENPANDSLAAPKIVEVSDVQITDVFIEDFEKYPTGVLADAPGSPWIRYSTSRNGNVTTYWVHGGQKNFQINSFTTSTEIDYALLNMTKKPDQLNVELWYTPDGFYIYKDFASVGLSYVASKYDMTQKASFWGSDVNVQFQTQGMSNAVDVYSGLEYGSGPAPSGTPKHNYIRVEFDFVNNYVRFYIGPASDAPLCATVDFDGSFNFNALFIAGGLNGTYIDDIRITTQEKEVIKKDVGVIDMDLPAIIDIGTSIPIKVVIKNYGQENQSNLPVSYRINEGTPISENYTDNLIAGTSATKTFAALWTPATPDTYRFSAWTSLAGDEDISNDALPSPEKVVVRALNSSPIFGNIGNQTVTAGQTMNVSISATDIDIDPLSFDISINPGFLSISNFSQTGNKATATLVIAPSRYLKGTFNAEVKVSDGRGETDSESFTIQIQPAPQIPLDGYRVEPFVKGLNLLEGTTTSIFGPNTFWKLSSTIDLPFAFTYLETAYNQIKVSSNGFLTFDISESYHYLTNDLAVNSPKNALAPLWDYLNIGSSGKVHYQTIGIEPNRIFIVEFYHVVWGPFSSPVVDFQIQLYEGSNDIEFHYGTLANAGFGADGASIGIKDDKGNFINALDGSREIAQSEILKPPRTNFRFTTSPPPAKDVGIASITVAPFWFVKKPDTLQIVVENFGSEEQTGFIVAYQIEGESPVRETFPYSLPVGNKVSIKFQTLWTPTKADLYSIKAWTELSDDANALNDSTTVEDAITVYAIELPPPMNAKGQVNEQNQIVLQWNAGPFTKPLPGEWNGITNEGLDVHMIVNFNSINVDSCEIYYKVSGDPFPFPLEAYSKCVITNNKFSFYYSDQYGRMSTDVKGTFVPADSCYGTWKGGVYVNNVYTVFSGTWVANAEFKTPQLSGFQIYRDISPGVQPLPANLIAEINDPSLTSYIDSQVSGGVRYYYAIVANYNLGDSSPSQEISVIIITSVENIASIIPKEYCLYPAYPNPFNPQTTISYDLPKADHVELKIYNILAEVVISLVDKWQEAGHYTAIFQADNLSNGIYFLTFKAGSYQSIKRVTLLK